MVPIALGMMCRLMIRSRLPPMTRTACTYSRVRNDSVSPRMSRAGISQLTKAMTTMSSASDEW